MEQIDYYQVALKFKYAVAARLQRERSFDIENISKVTAYLNRLVNDQDEAELFFFDDSNDDLSSLLGKWADPPLSIVAYTIQEPHLCSAKWLLAANYADLVKNDASN